MDSLIALITPSSDGVVSFLDAHWSFLLIAFLALGVLAAVDALFGD